MWEVVGDSSRGSRGYLEGVGVGVEFGEVSWRI